MGGGSIWWSGMIDLLMKRGGNQGLGLRLGLGMGIYRVAGPVNTVFLAGLKLIYLRSALIIMKS